MAWLGNRPWRGDESNTVSELNDEDIDEDETDTDEDDEDDEDFEE